MEKIGSMSKIETLLFSIIVSTAVYSNEIKIGLLRSVESNALIKLIYHNQTVRCEPYGIIPLEKMSAGSATPKECAEHISRFYAEHPSDKVYARRILRSGLNYHFELKPSGCVLYANGLQSFSEMLLEKGLALESPGFDDPEWNAKLKRAQKGAELFQRGLHETLIRKFCIREEK